MPASMRNDVSIFRVIVQQLLGVTAGYVYGSSRVHNITPITIDGH